MTMTTTTTTAATPVAPSHGALRPLGLGDVQITGGFWAQRQAVNGTASLAHIEHWMEREGWIGNFDAAAAGTLSDLDRGGREFSDSEVYKLLEAMAWEIGRTDDAALDGRFRALVARVAAAQEADGYLNTNFGRPGQRPRYSDLEWGHELYCFGHLFQAAVARARTRPDADDGLLGGRPPRGRPRGARRSARTASRPSAGTPRSSPRSPSWAAPPGSAATSTRPRCSSSAAAPGRSRTSSSAGRTTRTTCRCATRRSCAGTRCGPTTWPPARSTSRSRPTTRTCSTR